MSTSMEFAEDPERINKTGENAAATADSDAGLHETIAQRAYEIYQQREPHEGDAVSDWLQAESEVKTTMEAPDKQQRDKAERTDKSLTRASR